MSVDYIISLATIVVTLIMGVIAKKAPKYSNYLIPVQNLLIGVVVAIADYIITKDFNMAIAASGLIAGGTYDIVNNLKKFTNE